MFELLSFTRSSICVDSLPSIPRGGASKKEEEGDSWELSGKKVSVALFAFALQQVLTRIIDPKQASLPSPSKKGRVIDNVVEGTTGASETSDGATMPEHVL